MRISIVVPVFNVERYLGECVESLLKQGLNDYEVILVNDGSTDHSGALCDACAERSEVIRVIHKENGGLSDARNAGLHAVTGNYVVFVDSDDYLADGALAHIAEQIGSRGTDVVFLEATKFFSDGKYVPMGDGYDAKCINGRSKEEVLDHIAMLPKFPGSACTKMVRTALIRQHNLYFEKGLLSEDIDWTVRLLLKAETFDYYPGEYYFYRQGRSCSITTSAGIKNISDLLSIIRKWASKDLSRTFQRKVNAFMAYEYVVLLFNYASFDAGAAKGVEKDIKGYKWLLRFGKSGKTRLVNVVMRCAGFRITAKLLARYKHRFV